MDLISTLKDVLTYKEPKNKYRFELLEDEQEDAGRVNSSDSSMKNQKSREGNRNDSFQSHIESNTKQDNDSKRKDKSKNNNKSEVQVSNKLADNLEYIKREFNFPLNQDLVIREFQVLQQNDAFIVYIDGMADKTIINDFILRQLMVKPQNKLNRPVINSDYILNNLLTVNQVVKGADFNVIHKQILNGLTALFVDGMNECFLIESRGFDKRSVTTPSTEQVIKGSQEGFVENLRTNITLVRKMIKNKDLITEMIPTGKVDNSMCAIVYIKNITNEKIVQELKRRIRSIDVDFVPGEGVLDQLVEDHPYSIFPQILSTERPDRTASLIMEGKVAYFCEGTPYSSVIPITLFHMLHTSEDMILKWQYGTFLRLVRVISAFLAIFLPGLYIALTLYHQEMIPTELLMSLHKARENIPFPAIVEILLMELSFEIIREAGIRVPGVVGQTLGIIGAIVLGEAAVSAGLVSPVLIIIVAITGLGGFTIANFELAFGVRIARFIFIFLGGIAGFYGIAAGVVILGCYLCHMKSFGVPYMSPIAPKTSTSPDLIIRGPVWAIKDRPDFLNTKKRRRVGKVTRGWERENKTNKGSEND